MRERDNEKTLITILAAIAAICVIVALCGACGAFDDDDDDDDARRTRNAEVVYQTENDEHYDFGGYGKRKSTTNNRAPVTAPRRR